MSLNNFISEISRNDGLARTNRFEVLMTPPSYVFSNISGANQNIQTLSMFCDTATLPGINVLTNQNRIYGEVREIPYEIAYEPVTLTFYVDNSLYVKKIFDEWIAGIYNNSTADRRGYVRGTGNFRYYEEYVSNMSIIVSDVNDNNRYSVSLYEAYPKNISAINLDYAGKDVMKLSVTMQYKYWTSQQLLTASKDVTAIPSKYFSDFFDYQEFVNSNLSGTRPEIMSAFTGVVPIEI